MTETLAIRAAVAVRPGRNTPVGYVTWGITKSPPPNFQWLEGQTLATADYPELAAHLEITAETFTLPDTTGMTKREWDVRDVVG